MAKVDRHGGRPMSAAELDRRWATARIRAGLAREIRIEAARHGKPFGDYLTSLARRGLELLRGKRRVPRGAP